MKPLTNVEEFLKRFDNFRDGEFRSIEVISPTTMLVVLAGQDEARAFDWISVKLEFNDVSDARLLDSSKLSLLDMSDGISMINNGENITFGIGECFNESSIKNSSSYIESQTIKFEEGQF